MTSSACGSDEPLGGTVFTYSSTEPDQPMLTIIEAVAWANGVDPVELDPIHYALDPTAIESLFGERARGHDAEYGATVPRLTFRYEGCVVTVTPREVQLEPS